MLNKERSRRKLSRQEQRDLDIEIGFLHSLVQRDPQYEDALRILSDDYSQRGKHAETVKVAERLASLRPDDPHALYALACGYAQTRQFEAAVDALCRAVDRGYDDAKWILKDADLASLRKHPAFKRVRAKLKLPPARRR